MASTNPYFISSAPIRKATIVASGAVTQCRAVSFAGAQITSAGAAIYGIAEATAADTAPLTIVTEGEAIAQAGGTVALGAALAATAVGKLVTASTGNEIFARALEAATSDQYFKVLITREGVSA